MDSEQNIDGSASDHEGCKGRNHPMQSIDGSVLSLNRELNPPTSGRYFAFDLSSQIFLHSEF